MIRPAWCALAIVLVGAFETAQSAGPKRAPHAAPVAPARPMAPTASRFGVDDDLGTTTSQATLDRVRDAGFGWVHYYFYWSATNPADGVYEWRASDQEIEYILNAGLNVYARIIFPPAWATGVSYPNANVPYYCYDGNNPPLFVKTVPDCNDPTKIPTAAAFDKYVRAILERYGDRVKVWGFGAEAHSRVYWQGSLDQFVSRILRPGYVLAKAYDPGITVVGPDDDVVSATSYMLSLEAQYGRFCDAISIHLLRHSTPEGALVRLDESIKPMLDRYGAGRPFWITELGMESHDALTESLQGDWLRAQLEGIAVRPWIDKTFIYRIKHAIGGPDFGILAATGAPKPAFDAVAGFLATQSAPRSYYLAEGATGDLFDLDVTIANPNAAAAPVKMSFLRPDGTRVVQTSTLAPLSHTSIRVDAIAGVTDTAVSTIVESTTGAPLVVSRTMSWGAGAFGGHAEVALAEPRNTWYFAEGAQGFFDTYLLLANAETAAASVTLTFLREAGDPVTREYVIAPTSRLTVFAGDIPELRGASFSTVVASSRPIFAERAMYFGVSRAWDAGHESAGVSQPAARWFHAEGATGPFFDTYILVANPNASAATVTFDFLLDSGTVISKQVEVRPHSRLTLDVEAADPRLAHTAVSTTVSANLPIVSERTMYWPGAATSWAEAHNSFGVTDAGTRWGLAGGRVGGAHGHDTYVLVANPSSTPAVVRVTWLREGGGTVAREYTIPASSRFNVHVTASVPELAHSTFGAIVESVNGVPIVVEQAIYWSAAGQAWAAGTNAAGVRLP